MTAQANGAQHGIDMDAVHTAAASPDPRVRNVAQRRLEIAKEIEPLDNFLSFYATEAATVAVKQKAVVPARPANASTPSKTALMVDAAIAVVRTHGKPMPLSVLYAELSKAAPDLVSPNVNSMRAALRDHRARIANVDGSGYWIVGTEVPVRADA